ncbi:amidohydrolase family protein [Thalassotalea ponticola]|uniref:amidohydrolase family protein n=1 Tax=Thalassotalea ponticola TaxID=1523392 RepID=UPI0025B35545|nr:amidohydrolase family protein [Thalassotalea ponticola]MDN3652980.1 amidohydrolase family protein [Thalassotalea ponticola]
MRTLTITAIALATALSSSAYAEKLALVGGTIHTMGTAGTIENGTVVIEDGKISQVSKQALTLDDSYRIIDTSGKVVTPGFIGAYTSLGLVEVPSWANTVDAYVENSPYHAALDAGSAVTTDTTLRNISRIEGITSAATALGAADSMFLGQGAFITLGNDADPVLKHRAFMSIDVSNSGADKMAGSRASMWQSLNDALAEAEYAKSIELTPQTEWHGTLSKADAKALIPVINGDMPVLFKVHRAADIRQLLRLKQAFKNLDITLVGVAEGWRVAEQIAAADIEVIVNPESNLPYAFEQNGATLENAARLHQAGVKVAIGMDTHNIRLAPQQAGNAVANGLPYQAGLAALTTVPAKIYGIDDTLGRLQPGMQADVVVWSGDPLEVMVAPTNVIINGEEVKLESRQTKLRDRYLTIDEKKPQQYTRP